MSQSAVSLRIGGLARLSTCDWPGELAATVFCQGCAWACPYCHNPGLREAQANGLISWASVVDFLASRRGLLDAVVFSGGEPTLQSALLDAVREVRTLGFRVGLHTAGIVPGRFAQVLPSLDWVGFDVKAPFAAYQRITGVRASGDNALESLLSLLASHVAYEVRTTVHSSLLRTEDLIQLKAQLLDLGVESFVIQHFRPHSMVPNRFPSESPLPMLPSDYGSGFTHFYTR